MTELNNQSGQVVVILLLIIVVALSVGLSVVGRSVTEISTSTNTEESSRAFSAAEAGIERVLQQDPAGSGTLDPVNLSNLASANVSYSASLPIANTALEYAPVDKSSVAQFWLIDPVVVLGGLPTKYYTQTSFDVYFGKVDYDYQAHPDDKPAVEISTIYWDGTIYRIKKGLYDSSNGTGPGRNGFLGCSTFPPPAIITNNNTTPALFYCSVSISGYPNTATAFPVMVRVRLLFSNITQPIAVKPAGACQPGCSLPPQLKIYQSKGTSGNTLRIIQVNQYETVMPPAFDFALFSYGELSK